MRRIFALILCLGFLGIPARAVDNNRYIALTFDDGPSGKYTRELLDGLAQRHAKATFLLCGYRMENYPDLTDRIFREGHEIGIHGYSHTGMEGMSRREIAKEIMDTEALLPEKCRAKFLRPPGGRLSDSVRQVAEARRLGVLSWSVDPKDWATHEASLVVNRVLKNAGDGDVILLHDMTESSVTAALTLVDRLQDQGYLLVTVSELCKLRDVKIHPGEVYRSFPREDGDKKENS